MRSRSQSKSLSSGRPPTAAKTTASLSKRVTQTLIRSHHQLQKKLRKAEADGDASKVRSLEQEIRDLGGLQSYQQASIQGQSNERGGDSSRVLLDWLGHLKPSFESLPTKLRMLEVGALSTQNACSTSGLFDIERIDLHSQSKGILQQDFMERSLPLRNKDKFDIISLSLVLNFVPTPEGRGAMLKRTRHFLDLEATRSWPDVLKKSFPALFLVLPAACIVNSRYTTEERFTQLMNSLGYAVMKRRQTAKLIYYLWTLQDSPIDAHRFPKTEVNPGRNRNNFSIVLGEEEYDGS